MSVPEDPEGLAAATIADESTSGCRNNQATMAAEATWTIEILGERVPLSDDLGLIQVAIAPNGHVSGSFEGSHSGIEAATFSVATAHWTALTLTGNGGAEASCEKVDLKNAPDQELICSATLTFERPLINPDGVLSFHGEATGGQPACDE